MLCQSRENTILSVGLLELTLYLKHNAKISIFCFDCDQKLYWQSAGILIFLCFLLFVRSNSKHAF